MHITHTSNKQKLIVLGLILIAFSILGTWQGSATSSTVESQTAQILKDITPEEAHALIQKHQDDENFVILDVRTPKEFTQAHIKDAKNIDYFPFDEDVIEIAVSGLVSITPRKIMDRMQQLLEEARLADIDPSKGAITNQMLDDNHIWEEIG